MHRIAGYGLFMSLAVLTGCVQPQARFTQTECRPGEARPNELPGLNFSSSIETKQLAGEQLIYQVVLLDADFKPVRSKSGRYHDQTGNLAAGKTLMVPNPAWNFDNIVVTIPGEDLQPVLADGPAWAEFRVVLPEGNALAEQRVELPASFMDRVAAARPAPPKREERVAAAPRQPVERGAASKGEPAEPKAADSKTAAGAPRTASTAQPRSRETPAASPPATSRNTDRITGTAPVRKPPANPPASAKTDSNARTAATAKTSGNAPEKMKLVEEPSAKENAKPPVGGSDPRTAQAKRGETPTRAPSTPPKTDKPTEARTTTGRPAPANAKAVETAGNKPADRPIEAGRKEPADQKKEDQNIIGPDMASGPTTLYTIKSTDSLRSIAVDHYGDARYWTVILRANPDLNPQQLRAGDQIRLPTAETVVPRAKEKEAVPPETPSRGGPADPNKKPETAENSMVYVVREGDTLTWIARRVLNDRNRWKEIFDLNRDQLNSPDELHAGMKLRLPTMSPTSAPAAGRP